MVVFWMSPLRLKERSGNSVIAVSFNKNAYYPLRTRRKLKTRLGLEIGYSAKGTFLPGSTIYDILCDQGHQVEFLETHYVCNACGKRGFYDPDHIDSQSAIRESGGVHL